MSRAKGRRARRQASPEAAVLVDDTNEVFLGWVKQALGGLVQSHAMLGVMDPQKEQVWEYEFALQIGYCLMNDKPLLLIVPQDVVIPDKLLQAATTVQHFCRGNEASFKSAVERAFAAVGKVKSH